MKNLIIYEIKNVKTGKVYIGQTIQGLTRRKGEHIYRFKRSERDHKLYQSMRKHGLDAFKFSVICCALHKDYLDDLEIYFIKQSNSFRRGYNMTMGGDSVSDATREKLRKIMTGRKITWGSKIAESRRNNPNNPSPKDFVPNGANNKLSKWYAIKYPNGEVQIIKGLRAFCKRQGLTHSLMLATLKGLQTHHKGYSILSRFNDHPEREYAQAGGNGKQPVSQQVEDMIYSV